MWKGGGGILLGRRLPCCRLLRLALLGRALAIAIRTQGEVGAGCICGKAGIGERLFQLADVVAQQLQRFGALDDEMGPDRSILVDVQLDLDRSETARSEADVKALFALGKARGDQHRDFG